MGKYLPVPLHERGCARRISLLIGLEDPREKRAAPIQEPVSVVLQGTRCEEYLFSTT